MEQMIAGAGTDALLRKLRGVMAEPLDAQERLDKIVENIAANMVAEVCSAYVLRVDGKLELYASHGLNTDAVHVSSLRLSQGLVGTIASSARFLNLDDAQSHPAYQYLPETGEEVYQSFLGVPVLRAGRVLGVLVVQNKIKRNYSHAEVEAMETTAMVLGELIATGELDDLSGKDNALDLTRPLTTEGVTLGDGIGLGYVVLHEPRVVVTNLFNENPEVEIVRLREALIKLRVSLDVLFESGRLSSDSESRDVLETYRMFAQDRGWIRRMEEAISNGLTAEAAVEKVQNDNRARMMRQTDPYLRDRLHDLDDLANRLLRELLGKPHASDKIVPEQNMIVIARSMGAAELLEYSGYKLRGLVLEEAAPNSHVAIVARALGIPAVGQVPGFGTYAEQGNAIIVDGDNGSVSLRPAADVERAYVEKVEFRAGRQKQFKKLLDRPAVSLDGVPVDLMMNAGLLMDMQQLEASGAVGIGLFRTELQFMVSARLPRSSEQEAVYRSVLDAANGKPVNFRTLDVGGDKVLPYLNTMAEENPALGWRAIRLSLDRPALMRSQIKALLKASMGRNLRIMLPMVSEVNEIRQVRALIKREVELQTRFGHEMPRSLKLGAMIEVPSLLWQLDELMEAVDFASVGSNDLYQFVMASDRGNARLANRFTPMSKHFLRVLKQIRDKADEHNTPLSLCGEIAGRPLSAMALIGLGYQSLSMSPAAIGPVKAMLLSLNVSEISNVLVSAIEDQESETTVLEILTDYADRSGIPY